MTRTQGVARVRAAHGRFRVRVSGVKWWYRNEIAAAARALSRELEPLEFDKSVALRELAELLEVAPEHRYPPTPGPPSSRRPVPMPPDLEGDEYLLERMQRFRRPTS